MASEAGHPLGDQTSRPVTRRNFIVWYLAGLLTATVVAIVAPVLVIITEGRRPRVFPPSPSERRSPPRSRPSASGMAPTGQ